MAKRMVEVEQIFCDKCGADASPDDPCLGCGLNHCRQCQKTEGVEYTHAVWASGSGDGYYCRPCDIRAFETHNPLHEAFAAIRALRDESERYGKEFKKRSEAAEATLKKAQEAR
jgi:hypothetical protein